MTAEDWKRRSVCRVTATMSYQGHMAMMTATCLEVLSDLTNETLEGELADEQLGGLLVAPDFTERDGSGPETMRLLHTPSCSL